MCVSLCVCVSVFTPCLCLIRLSCSSTFFLSLYLFIFRSLSLSRFLFHYLYLFLSLSRCLSVSLYRPLSKHLPFVSSLFFSSSSFLLSLSLFIFTFSLLHHSLSLSLSVYFFSLFRLCSEAFLLICIQFILSLSPVFSSNTRCSRPEHTNERKKRFPTQANYSAPAHLHGRRFTETRFAFASFEMNRVLTFPNLNSLNQTPDPNVNAMGPGTPY